MEVEFEIKMVWVFLLFSKATFFQWKPLSLRIAESQKVPWGLFGTACTYRPAVTEKECPERTGFKEWKCSYVARCVEGDNNSNHLKSLHKMHIEEHHRVLLKPLRNRWNVHVQSTCLGQAPIYWILSLAFVVVFEVSPFPREERNPVVWREASYASDCLSAVKPTPTTAPVSADQDGSPAASLRPSAFFLVHLPYFQYLS